MATKEEITPDSFFVNSIKTENTESAFVVIPKTSRKSDRGERSPSALDLRTGTARKRSYSGGEEEANNTSRIKIAKRKPTDQELALNLFIKQLSLEWLDRRLTIVQQPRHRLAQLEAACRRQFPAFNERQIRLKIRGQLKLYRRNLKKAEERKLSKSGPLNQHSPATDWSPLSPIDQNPSYLACNPNAVWIARRALANERKRGKPLGNPSSDVMPLKAINDWQNVGSMEAPIVVNKPLPAIRPNSCVDGGTAIKKRAPSCGSLSVPPKRVQSNPSVSTSLPSPLENYLFPSTQLQSNNSATITYPLNNLAKSNEVPKAFEATVSTAESSLLNSSGLEDTTNQTQQVRFLNQTWPPPLPSPPVDPSACIIASCLRLAANFLLQSATFFESKNAPLSDMSPPLPASLFPPSNLPIIINPLFGGNLPAMPPLGTTNVALSDTSQTTSATSFLSPHSPSTTNPSGNIPVTSSTI